MNKDEVIKELIGHSIISEIGGEYWITEKWKDLLNMDNKAIKVDNVLTQHPSEPPKLAYDDILNVSTNGGDWPIEVSSTRGRERVLALMLACNVPSKSPDGTYRLRGVSEPCINVVGNIVNDANIKADIFMKGTRMYYAHSPSPKAFKNYILDGDALDVYLETLEGKPPRSPGSKSNEKWS